MARLFPAGAARVTNEAATEATAATAATGHPVPADAGAAPLPAPELAVVVPTFNERENVRELVRRLRETLAGLSWEIVFVDDDSPDGTAELVNTVAREDGRVRCIHRLNRRGLSSACIEGMLATSAPFLAVMDADLQHDERILPAMLRRLREERLDLVIGSRYVEGGGVGEWDRARSHASRTATKLARLVCRQPVADPVSGFFLLRREVIKGCAHRLSGTGFKILLDILASSPRPLQLGEEPYEFRARFGGESKFDSRAIWEYLHLLAEKTVGRWIPVRFLVFCAVGTLGVLVHMSVLTVLFKLAALPFRNAQLIATLVAMTFNYTLNNAVTYRDRQRRGWAWIRGLAGFTALCSLGVFANVGTASFLFREHLTPWALSGIIGVVIGAVWNYAANSVYTWTERRR